MFFYAMVVCAYGLARPQFWKEVWASGFSGCAVFLTTIWVTLATDLMWGLVAGYVLHQILQKITPAHK
jgi:MFS superfamily sulfate permease-like transporter